MEPRELVDGSNRDGPYTDICSDDPSSTQRGALHVERLRNAVVHPVAIMTSRGIDATRRIITRVEKYRPLFGRIAFERADILVITTS